MAGPSKTLVATAERSYYSALAGVLRALGGTPQPKVFHTVDQKAADPDSALYTSRQIPRGRPLGGLVAARGVVEFKGAGDWRCLRASNARGSLARLESARNVWSLAICSAMADTLAARFRAKRGWATPRWPSTLGHLCVPRFPEGVATSLPERILELEARMKTAARPRALTKPQGTEAI